MNIKEARINSDGMELVLFLSREELARGKYMPNNPMMIYDPWILESLFRLLAQEQKELDAKKREQFREKSSVSKSGL